MSPGFSGLILLNKPSGITSFRALNEIKKKLGSKKVGHAGTLDKFAEGLLIVLVGKMTKLSPYFTNMRKKYESVFVLGSETDTLDPEGQVIKTADIPDILRIDNAIKKFTGKILQKPPIFSAIHINGKRAYKLARTGLTPEIPKREITIFDFKKTAWKPPLLSTTVLCSKGTYIRSLARDIGNECGSCAYVSNLKRTAIGPFLLSNAVSPEEFDLKTHLKSEKECISSISSIKLSIIKSEFITKMENGNKPDNTFFMIIPDGIGLFAVFTEESRFLALIEKTELGEYFYKFSSGNCK